MTTYAGKKRTPEEEIKLREELKKQQEAKEKKLEKDIEKTFSTESGKQTLLYLMKICGYQALGSSKTDNGEFSQVNTDQIAALRDLYVTRIRPYVRKQDLADVEIYHLSKEDTKPTKITKK